MRTVPERPTILTFAVLLGAFLAGPALGAALGARVAPDSELAQIVTTFVYPLAFIGGLLLWFGTGAVRIVLRAISHLVRGRLPSAHEGPGEALVPPGYGAFVVLAVAFSGFAGLVAAALSSATLVDGVASHVGLGAGYGLALWWLAHHGYLPFPEPE